MKPLLMQPIVITLQPSVLLLGLLAAISIASSVILAQLQVPIFIKLGSIILVLISSAYFAMRDALLRLPSSWKSVQVNVQGTMKLINNRGENIELKLSASSFINEFVTILNFEKRSYPPVILLTSQSNQQELRKLRIWMRWWRHQEDLNDEA